MSADNHGNYHHGDLRNTLIIAAAELIEERGSDDFAMTDAARKAGVSNAAPYRHFKDKDDLVATVTQLGFMALTEQSKLNAEKFEMGSIERILSLGRSYMSFVIEHPAFFDLMWGDRSAKTLDDGYAQLKTNGFWLLVDAIGAWCQRENISGDQPLDLALKLWAMALGLSSLYINGHLQRFKPEVDMNEMFSSSLLAFLAGVKKGG